MRRMVEKMMACYGRDLVLCRGEEKFSLRGFFQPVTGKVERLALARMGPLGQESRERFIYIGPVEPEACEEDQIQAGEKQFRVCSAQVIWGGDGPVYCWAMCVEKGDADTWGSNG